MKINNFKKIEKGNLIGKMELEFEEWGLTIRDVLLLNGKNGLWLSMPSRQYEDNGQKKYFSLVIFTKDKQRQITEHVIQRLEKELAQCKSGQEEPSSEFPFI